MVSSAWAQRAEVLSERILIMKIVTSEVLAFLLIVGAWVSTHSDQEASAPVPIGVELIDAHVEAPAAAAPTIVSTSLGTDSLLGVGMCALGVMCGLLLVLIASRWFHSGGRPVYARLPLALTRVLLSTPALPRKAALSLTQLNISRT